MNKKYLKISLTLNILITLMTVAATIMMFTGFKFMHGYETTLESTKLGMLRFFTVQSNLFMGIVSLLFAIKEIELLKGKIKEIHIKYNIIKLMATTAVGLTCFTVFAYLGPISKGGTISLLMNSNLFFHCVIPIVSIITFIFFERTEKMKFRYSFYSLLPTLLYEMYYLINIIIHMENGKVSPIYDWYWFVQNGVWTAIIVGPLMLFITYIIGLLLWRINKRKLKN